ncbi:LysR family transcriptional regulator [Rhizobium rhizosphaerae]|uniref:HTH-type transcriptional regulator TtuA n=1 Tax=Xaviernesmea rhizosphaerae TaxID=1672749 RepID=A0A1Q9AGC2_9HYPH|nr:LysR family transcriptional regulator [Xaviernesmea rhizosphaerae]OLP53976.1 LysR family transcriptional regulator [Xaviernesmea rhizosphaerae]
MKLSRRLVPDIATLQAFECAARHGSFTQAAAELSLTQSAVSRQIKDLENQIGTLLFQRVRQRVVLSEGGAKLLPEVRRLLNQSEALMLKAMGSAQAEGALALATLPTFGSRWLTPRLPDFLARHPGVTLSVASRSQPFDFAEESFDLAIHYGQPVWAHAHCIYLCSEIILPVAAPSRFSLGRPQAPADLARGPLLQLATRPKLWAEWLEGNGAETGGAYRGNRFDQFSMVIEAAVAGLGFALVPRYLIEQELASGALEVVFERPMRTENDYYLVVPEGKTGNGPAQAFCAWIATQISPASGAA